MLKYLLSAMLLAASPALAQVKCTVDETISDGVTFDTYSLSVIKPGAAASNGTVTCSVKSGFYGFVSAVAPLTGRNMFMEVDGGTGWSGTVWGDIVFDARYALYSVYDPTGLAHIDDVRLKLSHPFKWGITFFGGADYTHNRLSGVNIPVVFFGADFKHPITIVDKDLSFVATIQDHHIPTAASLKWNEDAFNVGGGIAYDFSKTTSLTARYDYYAGGALAQPTGKGNNGSGIWALTFSWKTN